MRSFIIKYFPVIIMLVTVAGISGCKKFLDQKPDQKLVIPAALSDLQALLDNYAKINNTDPGSSDESADDYYLPTNVWAGLKDVDRRIYTWEKDQLFTPSRNAWSDVFSNVYTANSILEDIGKIDRTNNNSAEWDNVKGQAFFLRARSILEAAFIWTLAYDEGSSSRDLGLPLRSGTDFNVPSERANNKQTYEQVIADLKAAIPLLPVTPLHVMRSSTPAAYALLARTFLAMRNYKAAKIYSDSCLQLSNTLLDYNSLPSSGNFRVPQFNAETIYYSQMAAPTPITTSYARMDTVLYSLYEDNDLRKTVFFKKNSDGTYGFYGSYSHSGALFSGVATDEVFLMRAECNARLGNISDALNDLNLLLSKRYKQGFTPVSATDNVDALNKVIRERRKELIFRGLRWMDIKRFNKEGANIILKRVLNNQGYTLPPNDFRFALPIPEDIIQLSGMPQNPR